MRSSMLLLLSALAATSPARAQEGALAPPLRADRGADDGGVTPLFTQDRDNYFITGLPNPFDELSRPRVRFQLSIKYDLTPQRSNWALFFGFTQKSIWDLWNWAGSAPFEDSNYNPSFFWAWRPGGFLSPLQPRPGLRLLGLRIAGEHESNGQAGAISRGWNRVSGSIRLGAYAEQRAERPSGAIERTYWHLVAEAKGWWPFVEGRDPSGGGNPDLIRYYGYGQGSLEVGYDVPVVAGPGDRPHYQRLLGLGVLGRVGDRGDRAYLEAWLRLRPRWFGWLGASFFAQFVVGYGETLLRYDQYQAPTLRVGFALDDVLSTESFVGGS